MARIRTIKPEFFTSLTVAGLPLAARLTFIGLWTHADDEGLCVDDTRLIRAAIWPLDDRLLSDIADDLKTLADADLIIRYEIDGRSYLAIRGWHEHQRINRPTVSRLPRPELAIGSPDAAVTSIDAPLTESSVSGHGGVTEGSLIERKGRERKGTNTPAAHDQEEFHLETPDGVPGSRLTLDQHFAKFWNSYPRRKEPRTARAAWDKSRKRASIEVIQAGCERYAREMAGKEAKYVKYPATWLNADCWGDDPENHPRDIYDQHGWSTYAQEANA